MMERLKEALHYDPLTGHFTRLTPATNGKGRIGDPAGNRNRKGYWVITLDGEECLAHRLAWFYVNGVWPKLFMDHINGIRDDNRISNLREANWSQNCQNAPGRSPLGNKKGAHPNNGKWAACIHVDKRRIYLGTFKTEDEAHAAYVEAAKLHHGEFARFS